MTLTSKQFLGDDFLLHSPIAEELYHKTASSLPILDYHNHLSPKDIAENRQFNTITEVWLEGDHYKWRAMRANAVPEKFCTGSEPPDQKFLQWAKTVPFTLRNPLYHWTHLELKNYFGVKELLSEKTATSIYKQCNDLLKQDDYRVQGLLKKMKVEVVCTTDDPADSLEYHNAFTKQDMGFRMYPTFRPDKSYAFQDVAAYNSYMTVLGKAANQQIETLQDLLDVLEKKVLFFEAHGCRVSDHGLEMMPSIGLTEANANSLFKQVRDGKQISDVEANAMRGFILLHLSKLYHRQNWVQQFHLGALRNNSARMMQQLGADTGFDSIGDFPQAKAMAVFFNELDSNNQLAKTIIYNLNPADNELFATMIGNFNDGSSAGKIQWGSGWWFLDQKDGMEKQLNALSNMGLLSHFVGMVTDSRSFLSFPRHEYFRRIVCNLIGNDVVRGELPNDMDLLHSLVKGIGYTNAKRYFNF